MKYIEIIKKYWRDAIILLELITIVLILLILITSTDKKTESINKPQQDTISIKEEELNDYKIDIKGAVKKPGVYELPVNSTVDDAIKIAGGLNKNAYTSNINLSRTISNEMVIFVQTKEEHTKSQKNNEEKFESTTEIVKEPSIENKITEICEEKTIYIDRCEESPIIEVPNKEEIIIQEEIKDNNVNKNESENETTKEVTASNKKININTGSLEELMSLTGIGESKAKSIIEYREKNKFKSIEEIMNVSGIGSSAFDKIKDSITT